MPSARFAFLRNAFRSSMPFGVLLELGLPRLMAREIFKFIRGRLAPYKRIRRIEFSELPKTISGKIRRVQLRGIESKPRQDRRPCEYWEQDFSDL